MRVSKMLQLAAFLLVLSAAANAEPPPTSFGQSSPFPLDTNRIGSADTGVGISTSAPEIQLPSQTVTLGAPTPNPFNPSVTIPYAISRQGLVQLAIYDLRGRQIRELSSGSRSAGQYSERWDGRAEDGAVMPAGVYLVRVALDGEAAATKISLLK